MKKSDVQCPNCSAGYRRIELVSKKGQPGSYSCALCKQPLEMFDGSSEIAYRLTVTPSKYLNAGDKRFSK
jgi:DNA-directed RNA polymerase subunit RPC12/RpoP